VDEVIRVRARECCHCGGGLKAHEGGPEPLKHQQVEVPQVKARVTEYRLYSGYCEGCDCWTCAALPEGVPSSGFGVRLTALVALLTSRYRLSKRMVKGLLWDVAGVQMSVGSVSNLEQRMSASVADRVDEARDFVRQQGIVHQDETGWREALRRAWLWTTVTDWVTVFDIRKKRSAQTSQDILGADFGGFLVSDRFLGYAWVNPRLRQVCWSHLIRDLEGAIEFGGSNARLARALLKNCRRFFRWWHRVRDGTMSRPEFVQRMDEVKAVFRRRLRAAKASRHGPTYALAKSLLRYESSLWTFVDVEGMDPTNNPAERALRPAVIWRKNSFGTFSRDGSRFAERMLSVIATLSAQGRNVLEYLVASYSGLLRHQPAPTLLPY